jgi:hypothetical protein
VAVRALAALAIGDTDEACAAARSLFVEIVEPLSDTFEPFAAHAYVDVMAEVLEVVCAHPTGGRIRAEIAKLGHSIHSLARRAHRLLETPIPTLIAPPRVAVVLSGVTLGRDIALTSTVMDALLVADPETKIVFVGGPISHGLDPMFAE